MNARGPNDNGSPKQSRRILLSEARSLHRYTSEDVSASHIPGPCPETIWIPSTSYHNRRFQVTGATAVGLEFWIALSRRRGSAVRSAGSDPPLGPAPVIGQWQAGSFAFWIWANFSRPLERPTPFAQVVVSCARVWLRDVGVVYVWAGKVEGTFVKKKRKNNKRLTLSPWRMNRLLARARLEWNWAARGL